MFVMDSGNSALQRAHAAAQRRFRSERNDRGADADGVRRPTDHRLRPLRPAASVQHGPAGSVARVRLRGQQVCTGSFNGAHSNMQIFAVVFFQYSFV